MKNDEDKKERKLKKKHYFLVVGLGIALLLSVSIIMLAIGVDFANILYFWGSGLLILGGGFLIGKIFNLDSSGEAIAVFILIALVLYKIFD